jgi:hypothetical protein
VVFNHQLFTNQLGIALGKFMDNTSNNEYTLPSISQEEMTMSNIKGAFEASINGIFDNTYSRFNMRVSSNNGQYAEGSIKDTSCGHHRHDDYQFAAFRTSQHDLIFKKVDCIGYWRTNGKSHVLPCKGLRDRKGLAESASECIDILKSQPEALHHNDALFEELKKRARAI